VLKINAKTLELEATFHQYVQPRVHKQLSPFCTRVSIVHDFVFVLIDLALGLCCSCSKSYSAIIKMSVLKDLVVDNWLQGYVELPNTN